MTPQLLETVTTRANAQIDPSLHVWGWEITVYLFLGGIVAGILVLTAALELASGAPAALALSAPRAVRGARAPLRSACSRSGSTSRTGSGRGASTPSSVRPRRCRGARGSSSLVYPVGPALRPGVARRAKSGESFEGGCRESSEALSKDSLAFADDRRRSILVAARAGRDGPRPLHGPPPRHDAVAPRVEQRGPRAALPRVGPLDGRGLPPSPHASTRASGRRSCAGTRSRSAPSSS